MGSPLFFTTRSLPVAPPVLDWALRWPTVENGSGDVNSEVFEGVVGTRGGVFAAGRSWSQTSDGVGDKEPKSVLVKFPLTGGTGSGIGGAEWVAKPLFLAYRGNESFWDVAFGPDPSGASHILYATGSAQANGANNAAVLAKCDLAGTVLWTRILGETGSSKNSFGTGVTVAGNGDVYVAGTIEYPTTDPASTQLVLWKFDTNGTLIWTRTFPLHARLGWTVADVVVSVGYQTRYHSARGWLVYVASTRKDPVTNTGADVVLLKYDQDGTPLWATHFTGPADDVALGVAVNDHARTPPES